jgi:RimJ/RimL family protein N-acetyltransferase
LAGSPAFVSDSPYKECYAVTLPIVTERLVLRRFTHDDVQDIVDFVSHPSVARITTEIEGTNETAAAKYVDVQNSYQPFELEKCFDLAIQRKAGPAMGILTLVCKNHRQGSIGWALGIEHRGRGYVTEGAKALAAYAFSELKLHRIYATTSHRNTGSWRVMERLGMRREAHLREAEFRDGQWLDVFVYGILADEWQLQVPKAP